MPKLIYATIASFDGYVEDANGSFDWAAPDEEVHRFVNDLERPVGTYLYGRRMYDTMRFWETAHTLADLTPASRAYADIWRGADKVVFSRTLSTASTANTRIEPHFDVELVRRLKVTSERDLSVGGAELAGQAIRAGLVDELRMLAVPRIVGGGKSALPRGVRVDLELVDLRRFSSGVTYVSYRVQPLA